MKILEEENVLTLSCELFCELRKFCKGRRNEVPVMAPSRRVRLLIYFPMNIRKGTLSFPRKPRLLSSSTSGRRMTGTLRHCSRDLRSDLHSRANRISSIHCELSFLPVALYPSPGIYFSFARRRSRRCWQFDAPAERKILRFTYVRFTNLLTHESTSCL